jgi:hypothetical protein
MSLDLLFSVDLILVDKKKSGGDKSVESGGGNLILESLVLPQNKQRGTVTTVLQPTT